MNQAFEVTIQQVLSRRLIADIYDLALQGCAYWCAHANVTKNIDGETTAMEMLEEDETVYVKLDDAAMKRAFEKLYSKAPGVRSDLLASILQAVREDDAAHLDIDCADVIIQLAAFDEVRYG